jgi:transposase-like protein
MNENDLPETLQGAILYFANEENCHNLMVSMRWGNGLVTCPHCTSTVVGKLVVSQRMTKDRTLKNGKFVKGELLTRRLWNCSLCKKQFTLKTGTIFEDSPLGLDKWLTGLWLIVNAKNGVSSYEIAKAIGITQKSAWFLAQRIRLALHEGHFEKMSGTVESDESYIGAKARNMHKDKRLEKVKGTGPIAMTAVQGLLERGTRDSVSRVKLKVVKTTKKAEIQGNVREYVLKGSEVHTDALKSYQGLQDDFVHKVVDHAVCYVKDNVHTNGLENFWSLLKRTIKGTYVCPRPFHLFRYLDEQAFRFNERKDNDQQRFLTAAKSVKGRRLTYRTLIGKPAVAV